MAPIRANSPMETRPVGPIQLLSKASLRKYDIPISTAEMPIRFNQCEPMRDSRPMSALAAANCGPESRGVNLGGGNGLVGKGSAGDGMAGVSLAGTCDEAGLDGAGGAANGGGAGAGRGA